MTPMPSEAAATAWKRQLDVALQVAEAVVEGTRAAREIQREAAVDAHTWVKAARQSLAATPPAELMALQMRLANENLGKIAGYWSALTANARDTQQRVLEILLRDTVATPLLAQTVQVGPEATRPLNDLVDAGYRQWLETLRHFYSMPTSVKPA